MTTPPSTEPSPSGPVDPSSGSGAKLFDNLRADLPASIVVFFVAVPLCLGIALASGAPLMSGLIAGIVGGILVGAISGSPLGVSGPAAGLAVIVLTAIGELGSFQAFLLAVVLAGAMQVALGVARAGVLAYFFPTSVIKGMLAGIGILIILKQIPHALGHDADPEGDLAFVQPDGETTLSALGTTLGGLSPSAILISVLCLAVLILWETTLSSRGRIFKLVQGPLVAVGIGIVFQLFTKRFAPGWSLEPEHLVRVPEAGSLGEFTALLTHPDWSQWLRPAIWITAATIAVVASLETLLCVEATDKLDPRKRVTPTNRELVAQGMGNMASGLIGGLPVTQVIVRSSANIQSGGATKLSAILHGVLMLLFVTLLPQLLNLIPLAALASILLVVGYKLARPALFRQVIALGAAQYVPFLVTILGIVFTNLLMGIGLGMVAAIFALLRTHYLNSHFLHLREEDEPGTPHQVVIELAEEVTFLNKGALLREFQAIPDGSIVTIDTTNTVFIDQDVREIIDDFKASAADRAIQVNVTETPSPRFAQRRARPRPLAQA